MMSSKFIPLTLIFGAVTVLPLTAQDLVAPLPAGDQEPVNPLEELPIENGKINVKKLTDSMDTEATKVLARINEIDAIVNKAYAKKAVEVYGLEEEEYDFLRRQSEVDNKPLIDFFRAERRSDLNAIEEAHQYFTYAYDAISKNEFWYGREETLLAKDKALFQTMKQKVATELAGTEEGMKILDLEAEKKRLLSLMESQKPLFEYLVERRKWWKIYPDYENLVDAIEEENNQNLAP